MRPGSRPSLSARRITGTASAAAASALRHRALASPTRWSILERLEGVAEGLGVVELAEASGLHPSTVREHLAALQAAGLVEAARTPSGRRGRPPLRFRAAARAPGILHGEVEAALIATLAEDPRGPAIARRAGRVWGRSLVAARSARAEGASGPVGALVDLLDRCGFVPRPEEARGSGRAVVSLRPCPFGAGLARDFGPVVCGIHLGLVEGALEGLGGAPASVILRPFVASDRCLLEWGPGDGGR